MVKLKQGTGSDYLINMEFLFSQPPLPRFPPAVFDKLDLVLPVIDKSMGQMSGGFDGNIAVDNPRDGIAPTLPKSFRGGIISAGPGQRLTGISTTRSFSG